MDLGSAPRVVLLFVLGCGGTSANETAAATPHEEPTPVHATEPAPEAPTMVASVVANRLDGPFPTPCAAIPEISESSESSESSERSEIGCAALRDIATADATGPFSAVRFTELVLDEELSDSSCHLLIQTQAGWFHLDLELLCGSSGSVRTEVTSSFDFPPIGPERTPRLVVTIEESYSHTMEGFEDRSDVVLCGTNDESAVACTYWWVAQRTEPMEGAYGDDEESDIEAIEWRADLRYEPIDIVVIGEHEPPEHDAHPLPGIGRHRISF